MEPNAPDIVSNALPEPKFRSRPDREAAALQSRQQYLGASRTKTLRSKGCEIKTIEVCMKTPFALALRVGEPRGGRSRNGNRKRPRVAWRGQCCSKCHLN
jgi:hypothetical protein